MQVKIVCSSTDTYQKFQEDINKALKELHEKGAKIVKIVPCYTSTTVVYRECMILYYITKGRAEEVYDVC